MPQVIEGYSQSINTPYSRTKFVQMHQENTLLGQKIINVKPTYSSRQQTRDYRNNKRYSVQISHFGTDQAFKRKFSGYGHEAHHHGHDEAKFY